MTARYFVWISGLRGPMPQIWDDEDKMQEGKPIKTLTKPVEISDDRDLSQLTKDYPYVG